MRLAWVGVSLLLAAAMPAAQGQNGDLSKTGSRSTVAPPLFRISFERGETVPGISATPAIKMPWECTSDGTIFVSFVGAVPAGAGFPGLPPMLLASVSPTGHGQIFRLDDVPQLYISREVDHYASDSDVVFLVEAAKEKNSARETSSVGAGPKEFTKNNPEQHLYLVSFARDGQYRRTIALDDLFRIQHLGVFPSGTFLVFGFDRKDHSPKLAMLRDDGTLIKFLEISKGDTPESMLSAQGAPHPGVIAPSELVPEGRSLLVVQNNSTFPLLEVTEGGAIREIHPQLPKGEVLDSVIPADRNLYVIARPETDLKESAEVIYELSPEDGTVLRQLQLSDERRASESVACVHEGKFLSIDYSDGKVVPLIGSAEPARATAELPKQ